MIIRGDGPPVIFILSLLRIEKTVGTDLPIRPTLPQRVATLSTMVVINIMFLDNVTLSMLLKV